MPPEILSPSPEVKQPAKTQTADDINDLFKSIDDEPEKPTKREPKEKETKDESDKDEIEIKEPEEELEKLDLNEEKDEELNIDAPPRKQEVLKAYPDIFKKFPFLEKMMYRDREYTQLFGSFDDAKEVAENAKEFAEKSEVFNQFESQLLSGNTEEILREVKEANRVAFDTIVDEYLPTLAKVDKDAYFHVVGNLNKRLIMEMVKEANDTNNDDLKQAALLVNQFIFGTSKFTAPEKRVKVEDTNDKAKSEAEQERLAFVRERFESSRDELQSQVDNTLKATISDYIDPRNTMSAYVKKNAIADAMKFLSEAIAADPSVAKNLDKLWRGSFDEKFSRDSLNKIKSYYLSKAKGNLKNAILKARAEVKKDENPSRHNLRETDDETDNENSSSRSERRTIPTGRPSQTRVKDGPKKGESVADFFMRD